MASDDKPTSYMSAAEIEAVRAHLTSGLSLFASGDAARLLAHLDALTAGPVPDGEALPDLDPRHTPTGDRFDGEVWRGRVLVDDEWGHAGVAMVNGCAVPLFFGFGEWREAAPKYGYKVMTAWALAQRAAGRAEGEAERERATQEGIDIGRAQGWKEANGEIDRLVKAREDRDATIARLTAERDAARRDGAREEREACALTVESLDVRPEEHEAIRDGAAAIRARGQEQRS